jgi:hypothetical protein
MSDDQFPNESLAVALCWGNALSTSEFACPYKSIPVLAKVRAQVREQIAKLALLSNSVYAVSVGCFIPFS